MTNQTPTDASIESFFDAIVRGDEKKVEEMVSNKMSPNVTNAEDESGLNCMFYLISIEIRCANTDPSSVAYCGESSTSWNCKVALE